MRILFPAIMLHGTYDFTFMLADFLYPDNDDDDNGDNAPPLIAQIAQLLVGFVYVFLGAFYYFYQSRKQNLRLQQLDSARDHFQPRIIV